jgi:hypothetical protein
MGFRENLLKKIEINQLTNTVLYSMEPAESGRRSDREAMRKLLEMGPYHYHKERDLDLFRISASEILALDNELKIYNTTAEDIALRKSPTVKEMVSIRNAIKILNDKNVVVSRKAETVERVRRELIGALDLSFTAADIESLAADGSRALENGYAQGVIETLTLFAELLSYQEAPKVFQISHHTIWGKLDQPAAGEWLFGPLVLFGLVDNALKMVLNPVSSLDKDGLQNYRNAVINENRADLAGDKVWAALKTAVMENKPN